MAFGGGGWKDHNTSPKTPPPSLSLGFFPSFSVLSVCFFFRSRGVGGTHEFLYDMNDGCFERGEGEVS